MAAVERLLLGFGNSTLLAFFGAQSTCFSDCRRLLEHANSNAAGVMNTVAEQSANSISLHSICFLLLNRWCEQPTSDFGATGDRVQMRIMRTTGKIIVSNVITIGTIICGTFLVGCAAIKPVPTTLFIDGNNAVLEKPLVYQRPDGTNVITVPEGFVTDFASIPRAFWSLYQRTGRYQWAAVVHDYLYWEQTTTREEADTVFLEAMTESDVPSLDRIVIYKAVRAGGQAAWNNNKKDREMGLPRIVPPLYRDIPANTTWAEYRQFLVNHNVRP